MIDLSFLTEEEQEAIMKVLQRDAELKRAEEERVRHLPEKVKDDVQLKNMSGQWFYEAKSKRHRDKIHGADIIRASMRRKPATLAEVSQNKSNKAKNSWVSNVNKEVFVSPELHGIVEHQEEEQQLKSSSSYKTITSVLNKPEERPMKAAVSPVKQRRNPFNSTASGDNLNSGESENRPATLPQLPKKEILSLSEESQPKSNLQNEETEKHKKPSVEPTDESQKGLPKRPVPKARKLIHKATDAVSEKEDFVPKPAKRTERVNGIGTPPRGILKRSSSSSSTDSEVRASQMLDVQKKNALPNATIFEGEAEKNSLMEEMEDSTQISLEKLKQVRFSSSTGKGGPLQSPQLHHGREKGEFDLLESDKIKTSGNGAIRSDSFGNKHISAVKPLGTDSSALQVKTIDGLQDDTSAFGPCDTSRSDFLGNEALQTKTVTPKKLETPQKTSSNILPNSNSELSVDETRENKANQFLSRESKSHKNVTDEHQLSAKTEAHEVSNTNSTSLQQGKPDLVEERDAKTTFKPDRHADELVKVTNESVSKVLDWFKRSSGTEDRKHVSARSQGREAKEEVDFSTRTAVVPTEHSGPSMDGKPEVKEELLLGKVKQRKSSSSTSLISEDTQLITERREPKKEEENEEQNGKSRTDFDCTRGEEKERGQEIKQQNKNSNLLEHQEHKLLAQKCESEKAIREKRIREIRAFWEGDKTIPSHGEKEVSINTNASGDGALKGLRESDKIKPNRLDDQSKNTLRSTERSCASEASRNGHQNSSEFGPGHAVEKPERTLPSDGEVDEYTELPKAGNLQPSVGAISASSESKDKEERETLEGKVTACSQQKHSFQILSLKEKMNEKSKNQISGPSQFQNLRNFWDTGVKLQSSIDRGDVSLTNNTTSITCARKPREDKKGRQLKETTFHSNQCEVSERTIEQSHDISLADQKEEISKSTGKVNVPSTDEHENQKSLRRLFREFEPFCLPYQAADKDDTPGGSQRPQSGLQNLLRETFASQPSEYRRMGIKTSDDTNSISQTDCSVESTCQEDTGQPEEVNETTEKFVAPSKVSSLSSALEKLMREASEMPPPKPKRAISTVQRTAEMEVKSIAYEHGGDLPQKMRETIEKPVAPSKVSSLSSASEKMLKEASELPSPVSTVQRTAELEVKSTTYEHDGELPQVIRETTEKSVAPSKVSSLSSGLEKLLKEASEMPPPKPKRADSTVLRTAETEFKSITYEHGGELPQVIRETIEKSVAPSKVSSLSSGLEKLLKEASEMPPPKPKCADSIAQRTPDIEVKSMTYEHDGEQLQEIGETIEESVAPSKVSSLSSALEKLLKEASEPPSPVGTVQRTAELEVKSTTYEHDGELPREIAETIEKSVAPSKVSSLSSGLEKLLKEASETPPPKPKRADSTAQRTPEIELKSMTYEHDGERLQEIGETIEKSVAPSKVSSLSSALEKLLKEASEPPSPVGTVQRTAELEVKSTTYEHDGELPQVIRETIEKSVAPSKVSSLSSALEKLLKEASETPPPKPKRADSTVLKTAETEFKSMTYEHGGEQLEETVETIEKSVAPSKVSSLSSALEKLLKEASEPPSPVGTVQRTAETEVKIMTHGHDGELLQEIGETIERSALSKAEYGVFDVNLQKLLKEPFETPASALENMQGTIQTSQSMHAAHQQERDHPQEIQETIEKTSVSNIAKFSEFSSSLEKLLQEASEVSCPVSKQLHKQKEFGDHMFPSQKGTIFMTMSQPCNDLSSYHTQMEIAIKGGTPEQNIKTSIRDLAVSEIKASDLPKRNGGINKTEKRNKAPVDLSPLEGETNMIAIKPFQINEKESRDESTSLDASENNSEFKALLKFRRASTPIKDESNSPQPEGAQLCLRSQLEENDEEEGDGSNLGSKFSDENSDSHSGTGSSTRSEEELNPVLMALKRSADRKMPSKSLEDIPSATSNEGKINNPKEELALSAEDGPKPDQHQEGNENAAGISTVPSQPDKRISNPEKLKGLSKSVPSFLQEESDDRETDTASESSYSLGRIKKSPSSLTNLSGSSGMASLSSVSGSLMSIYSADFGNVDVKGNIQFAIDYVDQLNELHIFICQCKDLAVADVKRQRSDPYVKTYLLPEKYKLGKRKTSVKKKTFNPVYNEILRYKIEKGLLKNQSLNISVWHNDTFGRNSFLGEVELDLGTWDWNDKSNKQINWFPLKPRTSTMALELENRGEMKLALQYVPHPVGGKKTLSTGEVHIWVKECHDLPLLRGNRLNSFIKCTILPDTSRKSRQKTRTVAKTTNPVFNHTMVYDGFRPEDLKEACIELTVWDHNKLANHFLGGLRIGLGTGKSYGTTVDWMDSTSEETALWEKMINSPNTWIEDTLPLRMLMVAKLTK